MLQWITRAWLTFKYPDVCWKHKRRMRGSYGGDFYCQDCENDFQDSVELRDKKLAAMGVKDYES